MRDEEVYIPVDRNVLLIFSFYASQTYAYIEVALVFVLMFLMMPDTYLWRLTKLLFFYCKGAFINLFAH